MAHAQSLSLSPKTSNGMNRSTRLTILLLLVALAVMGGIFWNRYEALSAELSAQSAGEEEPELAALMSEMQRFSQKLLLAAEAENEELTDFYLHEMEELAEEIEREVPQYEGHAIGELVGTMLTPTVERIETRLETGDWRAVASGLEDMVQACNNCHAATDHGFIVITTEPVGAYNQNFRPRP